MTTPHNPLPMPEIPQASVPEATSNLLSSVADTMTWAGEIIAATAHQATTTTAPSSHEQDERIRHLEAELAEARRINSEISVQETDIIRAMATELEETRQLAKNFEDSLTKSRDAYREARQRINELTDALSDTEDDLEEKKIEAGQLVSANIKLSDNVRSLQKKLTQAEKRAGKTDTGGPIGDNILDGINVGAGSGFLAASRPSLAVKEVTGDAHAD